MALDASLWDEPVTGIGLYTRQLHQGLVRAGVTAERWGARRSGEVPRGRWGRSTWVLGPLAKQLARRKPRLYHAVSNFNLPLRPVPGVPFVLTVHDLVPLLLPATVSAAFRWQFRAWLARSLLVAQRIICVSETTRAALVERFQVDERRVSVVHLGVDHVDRVAPPDETTVKWLDALGLPESFLLYAGALDARKNVELVLKAVERLHGGGRRCTLVLAGQRWFGAGPIEAEVKRLQAAGVDVRALGYLQDAVFYALMKRAGVFVFPSRYEGFGLPPLEAMRLGVPTVVSTEGSLPEVCGEGALRVWPDDVAGLADVLERLIGSPAERAALAAKGLERAKEFRWDTAARKTVEVYRSVTG
jgi:glycosyltransferase involved in cell wall biosynthesis